MKTIQAVARYFPEKCGGIQTHLNDLLPYLQDQGVASKVVAGHIKQTSSNYMYEGFEVHRYPVFSEPAAEPLHGNHLHGGFEDFAKWLKHQKADIYHQHMWEPKCGLPHLRLAKELGYGTVVSVRLPHPVCGRNTLMYEGKEACDGKIDIKRCSRCCGFSKPIPSQVINALTLIPENKALPFLDKRLLRQLLIPSRISGRKFGLQQMVKYADKIVVMSEWVRQALLVNGIPESKLFLLKHGIAENYIPAKKVTRDFDGKLKIGFLGRWSPTKGVHILVDAIKQLPSNLPVELTIHGVPQEESYKHQVLEKIGNDSRIKVEPQVQRKDLSHILSGFDMLAVPSQWLETGPMVVLEAQAHGLPVLGSDLGGIAEKVTHNKDGFLLPASNSSAWAEAIHKLCKDPELLNSLREGIEPVRTIAAEAAESAMLYKQILAARASSELSYETPLTSPTISNYAS